LSSGETKNNRGTQLREYKNLGFVKPVIWQFSQVFNIFEKTVLELILVASFFLDIVNFSSTLKLIFLFIHLLFVKSKLFFNNIEKTLISIYFIKVIGYKYSKLLIKVVMLKNF
jgi:hypothetical protein